VVAMVLHAEIEKEEVEEGEHDWCCLVFEVIHSLKKVGPRRSRESNSCLKPCDSHWLLSSYQLDRQPNS
jgi:hypothetical protein